MERNHTFEDLFNYIQTAEIDEYDGYHHPITVGSFSCFRMQIYSHKRQVNIHYYARPVLNIVFDGTSWNDEVKAVLVDERGVADYDHPYHFTMSRELRGSLRCLPEVNIIAVDMIIKTLDRWKKFPVQGCN